MGAGSTPAGDYLRGVGIAAQGMGQYNLMTAQAGAINTQTAITWNDYVSQCIRNQGRELAERRLYERTKHAEEYAAIQKRLRENPEDLDVLKGDALNKAMHDLNNPQISDSSFRSAEVPLSGDIIRRIPFKLAEKQEVFSMSRLSIKGKGKLPPALQDKPFALYLKKYEQVLDDAMEQAIEGKATYAGIEALDRAVEDLRRKLNEVIPPSPDRFYMEAKRKLDELERVVMLFKTHKVQQALAEIDKYPGATVNDLRVFMKRHNLQFAPAETPDEKTLYPDLFESLALQRDKVVGALRDPGK